MIYKYFTCGSMDEKEGLTVAKCGFDEDGNFLAGYPPKSLYKRKEITEEEYNAFLKRLADPNEPKGSPAGGLLSEKGVAALEAWREEEKKRNMSFLLSQNEPQIALSVKKIKKMLNLGIIDNDDIDVEIEQQNMTKFKDEIKNRLETN